MAALNSVPRRGDPVRVASLEAVHDTAGTQGSPLLRKLDVTIDVWGEVRN